MTCAVNSVCMSPYWTPERIEAAIVVGAGVILWGIFIYAASRPLPEMKQQEPQDSEP